jgi:S-adenosylmethionine-diacylglycerol 3-amino-3-carboxypropyl transferase
MEQSRSDWDLEFANVWEDSLLDLSVLEPRSGARIVCVTSGGCTVLALLSKGATVTAVDSNPAQNALLELKLSAAETLAYKGWRCFLGLEQDGDRLSTYAGVRPQLSNGAQCYWDEHRTMIANGLVDQGVIERLHATWRRIYHRLVHPPAQCERWFELRDLEAQRRYYHEVWNTRVRHLFLRVVLNPVLFRWFSPTAGQYTHIRPATMLSAIRNRLERALTVIPTATNYFLSRLLLGKFLSGSDGEPCYLHPGAHDAIARARDHLTMHTDDLTGLLERTPPGTVNGFALSNVVDWLQPASQERLLRAVVRTAAPGARLCIRSVYPAWLPPEPLRRFFDADAWPPERLLDRERSFVYGTMYAAIVRHP